MVDIHLTQRPFIRWRHESLGFKAIGGIALAISIISGSTFNGFAKGLSEGISPLSLIFLSELLSVFFILLSFGLFPTIKSMRHLNKEQAQALGLVALLTGVFGPFLWFEGLAHTTAISAGFFSRTEMIFMLVLAHFFLSEKITKAHYSAISSILIGVVIISLRGFTDSINFSIGDMMIVLGVICYAASHIIFRLHLSHVESHLPLLVRALTAMAVFFVLSPFMETPFIDEIRALPMYLIPALFGFAFIARFLNSMMFYEAVDRLSMSTISLVSSLTVIGSTLFAWFYLGESLGWYHLAGGSFIVLGNVLLELLTEEKPDVHLEQQLTQRVP